MKGLLYYPILQTRCNSSTFETITNIGMRLASFISILHNFRVLIV